MADDSEDPIGEASPGHDQSEMGRVARLTEEFVHVVELAAAVIFALLFAIAVLDLGLQIVEETVRGRITDPTVVIGIIDTGLLLLIIVEVYQTVIAYVRRTETHRIVRLIIYTGIIAMVRKVIIFRTGDYGTTTDALLAAAAYTAILLGLGALLLVERFFNE